MADCSKTVEFIRELVRLCQNNDCPDGCPMQVKGAPCIGSPHLGLCEDAIAIVQKWSDEHPAETWRSKLRKQLPNAVHEVMWTLCPDRYFGDAAPGIAHGCTRGGNWECFQCWDGEYKEAT